METATIGEMAVPAAAKIEADHHTASGERADASHGDIAAVGCPDGRHPEGNSA
jgi:hypothetical protein